MSGRSRAWWIPSNTSIARVVTYDFSYFTNECSQKPMGIAGKPIFRTTGFLEFKSLLQEKLPVRRFKHEISAQGSFARMNGPTHLLIHEAAKTHDRFTRKDSSNNGLWLRWYDWIGPFHWKTSLHRTIPLEDTSLQTKLPTQSPSFNKLFQIRRAKERAKEEPSRQSLHHLHTS